MALPTPVCIFRAWQHKAPPHPVLPAPLPFLRQLELTQCSSLVLFCFRMGVECSLKACVKDLVVGAVLWEVTSLWGIWVLSGRLFTY